MVIDLIAGPERCAARGVVEVGWLVEDGAIMIAHQRPFTLLSDDVDALDRIGPIAHDVSEANHPVDRFCRDVRQHRL